MRCVLAIVRTVRRYTGHATTNFDLVTRDRANRLAAMIGDALLDPAIPEVWPIR